MKILTKFIINSFLITLSFSLSAQQSEMINNGTFDNASSWTITSAGDWVISGGLAHFEDVGSSSIKQLASDMLSPIQNNSTYILSFDITTDNIGGFAYMRIYDDVRSVMYKDFDEYATGSHQIIFTTQASSNGGIDFYATTAQDAFSIDNISLVKGATPVGSPYFISLSGHDGNDGSITSPFATPERAFRVAKAGDSIYVRAGVYYRTQSQRSVDVSVADGSCNQGEPGNVIFFGGYPPDIARGDSVIFDFSLVMPNEPDYEAVEAGGSGEYNGGFSFSWLNHFHLKDFTVRNVWQKYRYVQVRGMNFYGCNYFKLENLQVYNIGGQGIFSSNGTLAEGFVIAESEFIPGDTTYVINVDAYHCIDSFAVNPFNYNLGQAGSWAQGFFFLNNFAGEYQEFINCRAWECADDGYNNHGVGTTWLNGCWSFNNGVYLPNLDYSSSGNGYKINNIKQTEGVDRNQIHHWVTNSISAYCGLGFNENHVAGQPSLNRNMYNNIAYKNEQGFTTTQADAPGWEHLDNRYINNIAYDNRDADIGEYQGSYFETELTNSWDTPPGVTVTDADFLALPRDKAHNLEILSAPRKADGSLPDIGDYYKLSPTSKLIDAGTDVGFPFSGSAPDLGPFESGTISIEFVYPNKDIKKSMGDSIKLKARAIDTVGSVDQVYFVIENPEQDELIGVGEKKSTDEWEYLWEDISKSAYFSIRAKAINFNNDTATSQRIFIDIDDNLNEEEKSNCRVVYDEFNQNPRLQFLQPLKVDPYLKYHGLDAKTIFEGEFVIKDVSNEIIIDLSLFRQRELYLVEVTNVEGCLPQMFIAQ